MFIVVFLIGLAFVVLFIGFISDLIDWFENLDSDNTVIISYKTIKMLIHTLINSNYSISYNSNKELVIENKDRYRKFYITSMGIKICQYSSFSNYLNSYEWNDNTKILRTKNFIAYRILIKKMKKILDATYKEALVGAIINNNSLDVKIPKSEFNKAFHYKTKDIKTKDVAIINEVIGFKIEPTE